MALFFYRLLMIVLAPIIFILLLIRSINHAAYRSRMLERFSLAFGNIEKHTIVIHAASVGEVIAIKAYVDYLLEQRQSVTITTFTPTGSAQVKKQFQDRVQHCYLPLDIWPCTHYFLRRYRPRAVIFMETELWPNLLAQIAQQKTPLQLINGRLSTSSVSSYSKIRSLISPALRHFDRIICQSDENMERFIALGASPAQCKMYGNLKFDISLSSQVQEKAKELAGFLPQNALIWLVASTHDGDEQYALSAFEQLRINHPQLLLVIVPRHPERFDSVVKQARLAGFNVKRRSEEEILSHSDHIWVVDTLGELMAAYQLADYVTIGGSFSSIGGHNPLEPALFKKPIMVGHDMSNFKDIEEQMLNANGLIKLKEDDVSEQLFNQVTQLIELPQTASLLGNNAHAVVQNNQGASIKSAQELLKQLS